MLTGDKAWYALAAGVSVAAGIAAVLATSNLRAVVVVLACLGVLWWFIARLDWWQRFYALTLVLMVGAASTIPQLVAAAEYLRYAASGALLAVTWFTTRQTASVHSSPLHWRFLGMLWFTVILAGASTMWSESRVHTALQTVALLFLVGTVHLLSTRRWTDRATMVADFRVGMIVLNAAFLASIAALLVGYPNAQTTIGSRFQGIFNNPNLLGLLAAVTIPIIWGLFLEKRGPVRLLMITPAVIVLLLTESRTALVAVIAALIWTVFRATAVAKFAAISLTVLGGLVSAAANINPFGDAFERFGSIEGGGALNGRALAWVEAINLVLAQPLGYGWQAGRQLFESLIGSSGFAFTRTSVHNSYLQFLLELGLLGLIPLIYFAVVLALIAFRGECNKFSAGLVGTIVAGFVVQIAESAMFGTGQPYPYIFWFAVAGALTIYTPRNTKTAGPVAQKRKNLPDAYKRMKLPVTTR